MRLFLSLLFCLVLGFKVSGQGLVYAVADDDSRHAMIWHQALTWIYEDNNRTAPEKQKLPLPQVSPVSLKKFETDLKNASATGKDGYNFYQKLFLPAATRLYKPGSDLINSEKLIAEIVTEAANKEGRNVAKLRQDLTAYVAATKPQPEQIAGQVQLKPQPATVATPQDVIPPETPEEKKTIPTEIDLPMIISIAAFLLAAWALFRTFGSKPAPAVAAPRNYGTSSGAEAGAAIRPQNQNAINKALKSMSDELLRLRQENERLRQEVFGQLGELRNAHTAAQKPQQPVNQQPVYQQPTLSENPPASPLQDLTQPPAYAQHTFEIDDDHLIMETENQEPAAAKGTATKYARVPEDSVIKDRDMHADKSDNWSFIEISVSDPNAQTARFRINPHINHALAINNSLDRLENAFDFPRTANKATTIINQTDGELVRVQQGWKIEKRAKINLV